MPNWAILVGFIMGGVSRGVLIGCIVFCVSAFLLPSFHNSESIAYGHSLIFNIHFIFINGLYKCYFCDSFDDISIIPTFVLTPLIYLGGVFYSINILP